MVYLVSPRMIVEAYTTIIRPNLQFSELVEQSLPIYVRAPASILEYLAVVERYMWGTAVLGLTLLVSIDVLVGAVKLRTEVLTKALPLLYHCHSYTASLGGSGQYLHSRACHIPLCLSPFVEQINAYE